MNTNEPREPLSSEGGQLGDADRVEVMVEDLFIEEYPPVVAPEKEVGRLARAVRPLRGRKKSLLAGLAALGALALVTLFSASARPRKTRLRRLLHTLGFAR